MRRITRSSRNHFSVRGRDGLLEVLPYRCWIYRRFNEVFPDADPIRGYIFYVEWHTLNLKSRKSSETLSKMPHGARCSGTAVACGSRIYVLGGICYGDRLCPDKKIGYSHYHNCVFYLRGSEWSKGPPMLAPRGSPSAFAIEKKMYVFGSCAANEYPFAEVFNIDLNRWDELPPPPAASGLDPYSASELVLFDSSRSRMLVHFDSNKSLHAFSPDDGSWECLDPGFGDWSNISVIVDDVAYFLFALGGGHFAESEKSLRAYHVVEKKWFPVNWSSEPPLAFSVSYPDLLHLGNGLLSFAFCSDGFMFEKFRVKFKSGEYHAEAEPESLITVPSAAARTQISVL